LVRVGKGGPIYFCTHGGAVKGADGKLHHRLVQPDHLCDNHRPVKEKA
jgi:hypothetical protein